MFIDEIEPETVIHLAVQVNKDVIEFDSEVLDVSKELPDNIKAIAIRGIKRNNKYIKFSDQYTYKLYAKGEDRIYEWTEMAIKFIRLPKSQKCVHLIISQQEGKPSNRRESFRLWIGEEAYASFGNSSKMEEVVIKDISATGIGLVVSKRVTAAGNVGVDSPVRIEYRDKGTGTKFNMAAIVARIEEQDASSDLCGCKFKSHSAAIEKFIMKKQRERMQTGKGKK